MTKQLKYKKNDNSGANAYLGTIRLGTYFYNAIRQADGKYVVTSMLLESVGIKLKTRYANTDEEARAILQAGADEFMKRLNS